LISRIQRQLSSWVMITRTGRRRRRRAVHRRHVPIARWSFGPGGNDEVMIASEDAPSARRRGLPGTGADQQTAVGRDAARQRGEREQQQRCDEHAPLPEWSAARPPSSRKPAKVIEYASTTHCRSGEEKPRLDWIEGSATLTMLRSRMTMNCATQQTASSSPNAR